MVSFSQELAVYVVALVRDRLGRRSVTLVYRRLSVIDNGADGFEPIFVFLQAHSVVVRLHGTTADLTLDVRDLVHQLILALDQVNLVQRANMVPFPLLEIKPFYLKLCDLISLIVFHAPSSGSFNVSQRRNHFSFLLKLPVGCPLFFLHLR